MLSRLAGKDPSARRIHDRRRRGVRVHLGGFMDWVEVAKGYVAGKMFLAAVAFFIAVLALALARLGK